MPKILLSWIWIFVAALPPTRALAATPAPDIHGLMQGRTDYARAARQVQAYIQQTFYLSQRGLYAHSLTQRSPDFTWGNGVSFSALVGAARNDPSTYNPILNRFFDSLAQYWDNLAPHGGYEPAPTRGNGNDKYYDDNEWMALTYCEAWELTHDPKYLQQAQRSLDFALSGWDDTVLSGGIWWHVSHKSKNTCSNAPAAEACLRLACYSTPARAGQLIAMSKKIARWTDANFRDDDGLYADSVNTLTWKKNPVHLTYNTALMIRALLDLTRATGDESFSREAIQSAQAADWFLDPRTHAYHDALKWSHLMVEADLQTFRFTADPRYLHRAMDNADYEYAQFQKQPPASEIDNASIARTLWLLADLQSPSGQRFWRTVDQRMDHLKSLTP
jgi:uncharacterized protein YyaL (SSP411 family)